MMAGLSACRTTKEKPVRFAIASDFHAPDIPDGEHRVATFIKAANDEKVDFIIELGDFCRLDSASQVYRDLWNSFPGSKYHVIGNHDMDRYTFEEY
ncbi:MAG: metallophosphoesterase, partial [Muribaculaceae bacterium]|nr:metallophosphoesterase [Muribaculaceae bacterium]